MVKTDTKAELMSQARELIQRVGVNAMSYADLSKSVGISKASIHHHFPKKDDLILALIFQSREIYGDKFRAIARSEQSAVEKLQEIASVYYGGVCNNKMCLMGMLSTEFASLSDEIRTELSVSAALVIAAFEMAIKGGIDDGTFKSERSAYDYAFAFHSVILGAQILARCSGNHESFLSSASAYIDLLRK